MTKQTTSLTVIGTGIKFLSHLTTEARTYIQQADIVLYLVNDPAMKQWIINNSRQSESLDNIYTKHPLRIDCYNEITNYILKTINQQQHVCVVLYGHPTVFSQPALNAAKLAKDEGVFTQILPGISALDCLFAELFVDPGSCGCQMYEATDFLIHRRKFDPTSHLILWQVDAIGILDHSEATINNPGIVFLTNTLADYYNPEDIVTLYEAALYPAFEPIITHLAIADLPNSTLTSRTTLYIPPLPTQEYDKIIAKKINIDLKDLERNN